MQRSPRPRIIWDLDDTLNELMRAWLGWHDLQTATAGGRVAFWALSENPPHRVLGLSLEAYLASLDAFRVSPAARALRPPSAVRTWFASHGHAFEHHVISARPVGTVPAAAAWVFTHFGLWIRHFHVAPARRVHQRLPDAGRKKSEIIASLGGADFYVDDNAEELRRAQAVVRTCLLVSQPWNTGGKTLTEILAALRRPA